MAKRGRPSKYTKALADKICARLAEGETLRSICRDEEMPDEKAVRDWVREDREGFSPHYAQARDTGLDAIAEEAFEIADDGTNDWMEKHHYKGDDTKAFNGEHVQRSKLRVDLRKWYLSKMAPKRYGEKLDVEHSGPGGGPVTFVMKMADEE